MEKILRSKSDFEQHLILSEDGSYSAAYGCFTLKSAFQPIVYASGEQFGHEALLRVYDESGMQLSTEIFFTSGFMTIPDRINLDRLAKVIHVRNFARFLFDGTLFLNMAPVAILDTDSQLLTKNSLIPRLKELGLSLEQLYFEILEHPCASDQALFDSIQNMKRYGLQFAIDDYGIDGSSEKRARNVNPDIIKADRSLLTKFIGGKPESLVKLLGLARELNAKVLLEGVEDRRSYEVAQQLGIDFIQGYYVGHPQLVDEFIPQLEPA